ncbi:MAG: A/G-specific adenine glycosylase [Betaproteobacteria bacterium]|nr:A/G-specific adenine glycosylase [Betaproteobacteria bacterium]
MSAFAKKITAWQLREGRHGLPWQETRDAYRIWLSEIMLQQTQVAAVIPYYERFLSRFPDVLALACADVDDVMQLWAGLGYYARARNLHRAARQIAEFHEGNFPEDFEEILALPGVGRSTAAAISAFAFGKCRPILDGNVKRVFSRHFGVEGDVRSRPVEDALWLIAEKKLPKAEIESYTQGLMDLGATICTRTQPTCLLCPVRRSCVAFNEGRIEELPAKGEKRETPHRQTRMLVILSRGEVLLERRPPTGIWGGLWCLPELPVEQDVFEVLHTRYALKGRTVRELDRVEHGFTHYSLSIFPVEIAVTGIAIRAMEPGLMWVNLEEATGAAIPAPVKRILQARRSGD